MFRYFISSVLMMLTVSAARAQQLNLSTQAWKFREVGSNTWLPATVPGTVHTDLLANKKIPDPFYRNNEKDLQWIDEKNWEYQTAFAVGRALLDKDRVELAFEGLDTYADVFLNGEKILQADNMFRTWKAEVKSKLKNGINKLSVYFHSPINKVLPVYDSLPYTIPVSNNDQAEKRLSVFTRKAGYHYGWDWGPRFVTSGIWRQVTLTGWNGAAIRDVFIKQRTLTRQQALLNARLEITAVAADIKQLEVFAEGRGLLLKKDVLLYKGNNNINVDLTLVHPELWWPNGMGGQKLYKFTVMLKDASGKTIAQKTIQRGLRNIELVQESDSRGRSFYFKVNGQPVFMKGANYIPQDNFLPSVTRARYEHIINSAAGSHMNMLRVWGGGIYQDDAFYDLCDEKGILVWQDFMFACALFPPFENLKQNIYQEAAENVKRLRNHPSIALWCGNNEIPAFFNAGFWGQVKQTWKTPQDSAALFDTYKDIFHHILPAAVKAYDDEKPYWSTTPSADNYSMYQAPDRMTGDQHYWGVWGGTDPIEAYNSNVPRFMSEYGFQSFPEIASVKHFADAGDYAINSAVMTGHQRSNKGNAGITDYMKEWFVIPKDFEQFLYTGQLLQSEAIRTAMEAHRRAKPYCMGSLFWQIDDCWPAASWSSIDYYGRWKALQYQAKRSFATVIVSAIAHNGYIDLHLVSDSLKSIKGTLQLQLIDFNGRILKRYTQSTGLEANGSSIIYKLAKKDWIGNYNTRQLVLTAILKDGQKTLAKNQYYFEKPKDLELPATDIKYKLTQKGNTYQLTLKSARLARFVKIAVGDELIVFSDNYFDLLPNQPCTITFRSSLSADKIKGVININSFINTMPAKN